MDHAQLREVCLRGGEQFAGRAVGGEAVARGIELKDPNRRLGKDGMKVRRVSDAHGMLLSGSPVPAMQMSADVVEQ
jgi:hypothetical protein